MRSKHTRDTQTRTSCRWICFVVPFFFRRCSCPWRLDWLLQVSQLASPFMINQQTEWPSITRRALSQQTGCQLWRIAPSPVANGLIGLCLPEYVHSQSPTAVLTHTHTSLQPAHAEGYVNRFPSTQLNKRDGSTKIGSSGYHKTVCCVWSLMPLLCVRANKLSDPPHRTEAQAKSVSVNHRCMACRFFFSPFFVGHVSHKQTTSWLMTVIKKLFIRRRQWRSGGSHISWLMRNQLQKLIFLHVWRNVPRHRK